MQELLQNCRLCPRNCGVDRTAGKTGACHVGAEVQVARAALHFGEEPCISGTRGSGAVFFVGCGLGCVYCQNSAITQPTQLYTPISVERLTDIFLELQAQGAHNINLVTATQFAPQVAAALRSARARGLHLPIVYNSSGYEKPETLALLEGLVTVYLPDFKYVTGKTAALYSHAPDYPQTARIALSEMVRQVGPPRFDADGILQRGVIVRHLLLPHQLASAKWIVHYLAKTYGKTILLSLMRQYTPMPGTAQRFPELSAPVRPRDYDRLVDYAAEWDMQGYMQEEDAIGTAFIPAFNGEGVYAES